MKVAVWFEFSGRVREALRKRGHDAVSCDILPSEQPGPHVQGDVRDFDLTGYDALIAHPPCTYLCNSGVRWLHTQPGRWAKMEEAAKLFRWVLERPVAKIGVENPIMHKYAVEIVGRRQDQVVQPWMFGHGETKATAFWLKGLEPLRPTLVVSGREAKVHRASPSPDRWKQRSITYQGIADAIADQWCGVVEGVQQ